MDDMSKGKIIMKCKKCRKAIPDDSKFCCYCGKSVSEKKPYRRPDGLYEKSLTIGGKRHVFRGKSQKEILSKIAEFQAAEERGKLFKELVEDWDENYCSNLVPATVHGYTAAKNSLLNYFGNDPVSTIKTADLQAYVNQLPTSFTKKTIRNYMCVASSIFCYAVRSEDYNIDTNPCSLVKVMYGKPSSKRRIPTENEVKIITENAKTAPFGMFAFFCLFTGCRPGEALAIRFEDIDTSKNVIHINKALSWENSKPFIKSPKTDAGLRDIYLLPRLREILPTKRKGFVFPNKSGELMTQTQYRKAWDKYRKFTGLSLTAYCLRHGFATLLYEATDDLKYVQEQMGHSSVELSLGVYTHLSEKNRRVQQKKLEAYTGDSYIENIQ